MDPTAHSLTNDIYLHNGKSSSNKNTLFIIIAVVVLVILGLVGLSAFLVLNKVNNNQAAGQCSYDGKTYQYGESFKSTDMCNTCSCSSAGVACTEMACITDTPQVSLTPTVSITATPSVSITPSLTSTPTVTPTVAEGIQIYFGKPESGTDYITLIAVGRPTDVTGSGLYSFVINQVITGPTAVEKAAGINPVLQLSGSSTCGGSSYQFNKVGNTMTVKFCKQLNYATNAGASGSYSGLGLAANGRIYNALAASLKFNGVTKVVVKDSNNNCFAQDSGVNLDCTP